jgi:hypothetical protein
MLTDGIKSQSFTRGEMIARGSEIATNIYMTILWRDLLPALIEGGGN